jgi:FdhE protein
MVQRVLEPGQIETLASRSIPRVRLPERGSVFAKRAARLRHLSVGAPLGDYLQFLAVLVDAQQTAILKLTPALPTETEIALSGEHGMPPIQASVWLARQTWRETLDFLCTEIAGHSGFPAGVGQSIAVIRAATPAWLEAQAVSILDAESDTIDARAALFIMAALQVHGAALAAGFVADKVNALEIPGICPLCGTLPVASMVCAQQPYSGYRYLHCALCATEWHLVRVQCSQCGASGKDIAYQSAASSAGDSPDAGAAAVRAETCEHCRGYCKILYQEKDPGVEPVADDIASMALDLLLGEAGYHRARSNPLLWLPTTPQQSA